MLERTRRRGGARGPSSPPECDVAALREWRERTDSLRLLDGVPPRQRACRRTSSPTINGLKAEARAAGRDVVDFGFGNPDLPSPDVAVEKLAEAAHNPKNHRYSASRGIPNLRLAIATRYKTLFDVDLDPDTEVVTTIGAKEGFTHLMWVLLGPGDAAIVPSPSYPIHLAGPGFAGASVITVAHGRPGREHDRSRATTSSTGCSPLGTSAVVKPRVIVISFPHNPTSACVDLAFMERLVAFALERDVVVCHDFAYADLGFDGYRPPSILQVPARQGVLRRALHPHQVLLDGRLAGGLPRRQRRDRRRPHQAEELPRLRHLPAGPDRRHRGDERGARLPRAAARDLPVAS